MKEDAPLQPVLVLRTEKKKSLKGLRIAKMKIYILAPAQAKRMQPILVSCRPSLDHWSSEGHGPHWTSVFLQIAPKRCLV